MSTPKQITLLAGLFGLMSSAACGFDFPWPTSGVDDGDDGDGPAMEVGEYQARILIEHNAADDDTGYQIFFDWEPWAELTMSGPAGKLLEVEAQGAMAGHGLTEMFFETREPHADQMSLAAVLALFPEDDYTFEVTSIEGATVSVHATLTHDIPAGVVISAPLPGSTVPPDDPLVVSWTAVGGAVHGGPVDVVAYQLIVEPDLDLAPGDGFTRPVYDVTVPSTVTSLAIPEEYLRPGTPYEVEVLAIEESGNQTIQATTFETMGMPVDDQTEVPDPGPTQLADAKFLIEHNYTDQDTGYQLFLDAEAWREASVDNPSYADILRVSGEGNLGDFGLTEMFFETNEPPADEVSLMEVLALFPEGSYPMEALSIDDATIMVGAATLSHHILKPAVIASPGEGALVNSSMPLQISWTPQNIALDLSPLNIVAFQVIVTRAGDDEPTAGFFQSRFSAHVPPDVTSMTVPAEFLAADSEYEIEVLVIEGTGNQTIAAREFTTP